MTAPCRIVRPPDGAGFGTSFVYVILAAPVVLLGSGAWANWTYGRLLSALRAAWRTLESAAKDPLRLPDGRVIACTTESSPRPDATQCFVDRGRRWWPFTLQDPRVVAALAVFGVATLCRVARFRIEVARLP